MAIKLVFLTLVLALTWAQFDLTFSLPADDGTSQVNGPTDPDGPEPTDPPLGSSVVKRSASKDYRIQERLLSRKGSALQIQHVEFQKLRGDRRKRAVFTSEVNTWPRQIPFKIKDGMPSSIEKRLRNVLEYVEDNLCVKYFEEPNFDPDNNNYGVHSYILFSYNSQSCFADVGRGGSTSLVRQVSTCTYWSTMIHELFHSLGTIHEHQAPNSLSYLYLQPSNIISNYYYNFPALNPDQMVFDFFDSSSVMMYSQTSLTSTGLPTIMPMRHDLYSRASNNIRSTLYQLNRVYKCRELECNNATVDCGLGYYTKVQGQCKCVCPEGFISETHCSTLYGASDIPEWPNAPVMLWSAGPDSCPEEMTEGIIQIPAYVYAFADTDLKVGSSLYIRVCSLPSTATDLSAMPKGNYCVVKPLNIPCDPFVEAAYSMYSVGYVSTSGNVGDVTVENGRNITMRFCCRNDGSDYPMVLRNAQKFRLLPYIGTSCPAIDGMISRWGKTGFYTSMAYLADVTPKVLKYSTSFYIYHCMYYAPSYDCNREIELNGTHRVASVSTPGFEEGAREPNRRCLYYFKLPKGSRAVVTFEKFNISTSDRFLINRYNPWVKGQSLTNTNYPKHLLSIENFLFMQFWSYANSVQNEGVAFTVKITALEEEMCYDVARKGSDYSGNKWMTVGREPCIPWTDAMSCDGFPYHGATMLDLKAIGNKCRNPCGQLAEPWCYTAVKGETCQKAYCDACNMIPMEDEIDTCQQMIDQDPDFCTTSLLRLDCAQSCDIFAYPPPPTSTGCPEGWTEHKDRCWKWIADARTQTAAEGHCNTLGGTIFRLRNQEDANLIRDFQTNTPNNEAKLSVWANGRYTPHSGQFQTLGDLQPLPFEDLASTAVRHDTSQGNLYILAYDHTEAGKLDTAPDSATFNVICEKPRLQLFGPPTTPASSAATEELKSEYTRGDRVTFQCTENGYEFRQVTIECGIEGWPTADTLCDPCPVGWTLYKDRCWIWDSTGRYQHDALAFCQNLNATMFKIRDQEDLDEIRFFKQTHPSSASKWNTWINAKRDADGQYYTLDDHTPVTFTPWAPNAVHTDPSKVGVYLIGEDKTHYKGTYQPESTYKPYRVFCERPAGPVAECGTTAISTQRCLDSLSFIPDLCSNPERAELARFCSGMCSQCADEEAEEEEQADCPSDWLVKGNRCYKWFGYAKTQSSAETYCNNLGGTLFKVKNAGDLNALRDFLQASTAYGSKWNVWMNARRDDNGVWRTLDDQTPVEYFNWQSGLNPATYTYRNAFLNGESKSLRGYYSITHDSSVFRFFCQLTLNQVPQCPIPAPAEGAHSINTEVIGVGDVMSFECDGGLLRDGGNVERTCLPDLTLAGHNLVCSDSPRAIRLNQDLIVSRPKTLDLNAAFAFAVPEFTIPRDGKISEWFYFALVAGDINFMVFRQTNESSGIYTKVGLNSVSITTINHKMSFRVPDSERIQVQAGDFLGVYSTTAKIATHFCSSASVKLMTMGFLSSVNLADLDSPQAFSTKCAIPSVGATLQTLAAP